MTHLRSWAPSLLGALAILAGCTPATTTAQPSSPVGAGAAPSAARAPVPAPAASPVRSASPGPSPVAAAPPVQLGPGSPRIRFERVATFGDAPIFVTPAGDGSERLFVVEKQGRIRIVRDGAVLPTAFLDISSLVKSNGSEQGLLSVAFHPDYARNGSFYVDYTNREGIGNTVVARYQVSRDNPDQADPSSATTLLTIEQPYPNHNGGLVMFGPDGYLYVGMGDGGSAGDPKGNGQNKGVLLGKLLRIDVNSGSPYSIPPDNPFANEPGARPEIWAYGLRNPWRFSFDRATGDLYIADVGQNRWEEVDFQPSGQGGQNYGWNVTEGSHCFPREGACDPSQFVLPVAEYSHSLGISITGGYVYRGSQHPQLSGLYFYADYGSGRVWALQRAGSNGWRAEQLQQTDLRITSFGQDESGELYVTSMGDNALYRLSPE